jgi:hypothetical protein
VLDGLPRTVCDRFEIKFEGGRMIVDARYVIVHATDLATDHIERSLTEAVRRLRIRA